MGNINNMRNVANSDHNMKSYIKDRERKPRLNDKTIRGTLKLIGPNAKKYRLSPKQRSKQLTYRVGLGIAGLAAAFSVANATIHSNANSISDTNTQYSSETQTLSKDEVLSYAENKLMTLIFKDNLSLLDSSYVEYSHNDEFNIDKLEINRKIKYAENSINKFSYTRHNNPEDKYLNRKNNNEPEITALLNLMLDIRNNPNPSQEDLENLNTMLLKLDLNNLVLNNDRSGNTFIVNESEKDSGYEIGD